MPMFMERWERRDGTDRNAMAQAALNRTRSLSELATSARVRFYWEDWDILMIVLEDPDIGDFRKVLGPLEKPNPTVAGPAFALADLARRIDYFQGVEPAAGARAFEAAGREAVRAR